MLCVDFYYQDSPDDPDAWGVCVDEDSENCSILWGFGRRVDAEVAMKFLETLPINWLAPSKAMWRQIKAAGYPDRDSLMRAACELLQW